MTPILVRQPDGSRICGQCCVAMVARVNIGYAIEAVGKRASTRSADIRRGLANLNIRHSTEPRLVSRPQYRELPARCIATCHVPYSRRTHWVVLWDGVVYDPVYGISNHIEPRHIAYVTSYIEIY
jgi:hypothetical protein